MPSADAGSGSKNIVIITPPSRVEKIGTHTIVRVEVWWTGLRCHLYSPQDYSSRSEKLLQGVNPCQPNENFYEWTFRRNSLSSLEIDMGSKSHFVRFLTKPSKNSQTKSTDFWVPLGSDQHRKPRDTEYGRRVSRRFAS
jgi:hypothetical protein